MPNPTALAAHEDQSPQWGTLSEAADILKVTPQTIRRWIAEGHVDARRFGARIVRVNLSTLGDRALPLQYRSGGAR